MLSGSGSHRNAVGVSGSSGVRQSSALHSARRRGASTDWSSIDSSSSSNWQHRLQQLVAKRPIAGSWTRIDGGSLVRIVDESLSYPIGICRYDFSCVEFRHGLDLVAGIRHQVALKCDHTYFKAAAFFLNVFTSRLSLR